MADLARIKRNVAKMAAQNAPEADIDGYIAKQQAAGLDNIITELQKQVDAFLASKSDK